MIPRLLAIFVATSLVLSSGYWMLRSAGAKTESPAEVPRADVAQPCAEFDHRSYDFGVMDVGETGTHVFTVRNSGTAPLTLRVVNTSCKCTLVQVPAEGIPPGATRQVTLEWKTVEPIDGFRHGGTLLTNDPRLPSINVFIEGRVRARIAALPDVVNFTDVIPGHPRAATVSIVSQVWEQFDLEMIDSTLAGIRVMPTEPPGAITTAEWTRGARAWQVICDASLPLGEHRGVIRYRVKTPGDDAASARIRELPLFIDMVRPFTMHGRSVEANAVVWGPIRRGQGRRETVQLIARKMPAEFAISRVSVEPPVLQIHPRRQDDASTSTARFALDVALSPQAAPVDCMTPHAAQVTLHTNHPDYRTVTFYVEFAVVE